MSGPVTSEEEAEQRRARATAVAAYRAELAASRLNRDRWPTDLLRQVETAERAMRAATS